MADQVVLSWSGGKDSALALSLLSHDAKRKVVALLTSVTRDYDRISVHGVRRRLLEAQVKRLDLPLVEINLDASCTNEAYESAFHASLDEIRARCPEASCIAFGDLFLEDVRAYRERLLAGTGFRPIFPLWGLDTTELARRFVADGFSARLVCVDTTQLDERFGGREFDERLLADLPAAVDPCGENGEFHTFVSNGPVFSTAVPFTVGKKVLRDERFLYCDLLPAE